MGRETAKTAINCTSVNYIFQNAANFNSQENL